uniref:GST N-terminal domain-containing protein n=1 Tax=Strigops habroptila TaxID=2489341 RepID=A0A672U195_STRHB
MVLQRISPCRAVPRRAAAMAPLVLYHWTQSFSSQKVRLAIAEKALKCEEHDVNLPLSEHNEPWFMRLEFLWRSTCPDHGENIICEATQDYRLPGSNVCGW